jgi:hypothetical protein
MFNVLPAGTVLFLIRKIVVAPDVSVTLTCISELVVFDNNSPMIVDCIPVAVGLYTVVDTVPMFAVG